ncbi:hypothetical protein BBP40_004063 [Aspergillus hancockii]|nr:hypothetical protein BBP40_004063 [Aspergillus hancockii]
MTLSVKISTGLRDLADKVDHLAERYHDGGDRVLECFINDYQFQSSFCDLWDNIPNKWKARLKTNRNRLYSQLRAKAPEVSLDKTVEGVVWNWATQPDEFYYRSSTVPLDNLSSSAGLDSIFSLIDYLDSQGFIDKVRRRLSLLFIAEIVDGWFASISDIKTLVDRLIQRGLISKARHVAEERLPGLLKGGRRYKALADSLGGPGALIYLPDYGHSAYEDHFHPNGDDGERIIHLLQQTVPKAAKKKRNGTLTAHDVANTIYNHKFKELGSCFIDCNPPSQQKKTTKEPVKMVRRNRKRAKYDSPQKSKRTDRIRRSSPGRQLNEPFRENEPVAVVVPSAQESLPTIQNTARERESEVSPEDSRSIHQFDPHQACNAQTYNDPLQPSAILFLRDGQAEYTFSHNQAHPNLHPKPGNRSAFSVQTKLDQPRSKNSEKMPNQPAAPQNLQFFHYRFIHQPTRIGSMQHSLHRPGEYTDRERQDGEQRDFIQTNTLHQSNYFSETETPYLGSFNSARVPQHTEKAANQPTGSGGIQPSHDQFIQNRSPSRSMSPIGVQFPSPHPTDLSVNLSQANKDSNIPSPSIIYQPALSESLDRSYQEYRTYHEQQMTESNALAQTLDGRLENFDQTGLLNRSSGPVEPTSRPSGSSHLNGHFNGATTSQNFQDNLQSSTLNNHDILPDQVFMADNLDMDWSLCIDAYPATATNMASAQGAEYRTENLDLGWAQLEGCYARTSD